MKLFIATLLHLTLLLPTFLFAKDHAFGVESGNLRSMMAANTDSALDPKLERDLSDRRPLNCTVTYYLYNSKTDDVVTDSKNFATILDNGETHVNPTPFGRTNIEGSVFCMHIDDDDVNDDNVDYEGKMTLELFQGSYLVKRMVEKKPPFFLYGNIGDDVLDGTIKDGHYGIRAYLNGKWTPFTNFTLVSPKPDCTVSWKLYNSKKDKFAADLTNGVTIARPPPCGHANIEAVVPCANKRHCDNKVTIELYQGSHLIKRRKEFEYRYFLYGNNGYDIFDGKIAAGCYGVRAYANGKWSPFTNFTLGGKCGLEHHYY